MPKAHPAESVSVLSIWRDCERNQSPRSAPLRHRGTAKPVARTQDLTRQNCR
jgi:hypothetical protein